MAYEGNWIESWKISAQSVSKIWAFLQRYERCLLHRLNGNEQGLKLESFDGTNLEHIIRILSNSTQKELAIAQMLSLRKLARGAVKYHLAWMNHGIGIHWKTILSSWRWMLQGISNCIFHHWAASGISSTFIVHTAGSIWWTGSVKEKLNLDYYDLIF